MRAGLLTIMVALALFATGCTGVVAGVALPVPNYQPYDPTDAGAALGDFTTVDPCALLDFATLPKGLGAVRQPPQSLDDCPLDVEVAGATAHADVGELVSSTGSDVTDQQEVDGGLIMAADKLSYGTCTAYLSFATHQVYLMAEVYVSEGDGSDALCTASQDLAKNVATVLSRQRARHLGGVPARSLQRVDACGTVSASVLDSVGLGTPNTYPAKHQCVWDAKSDQSDEYAQLLFLVGPTPEPVHGGTVSQIGGRRSVVAPTAETDFAECQIDTGGIAFGRPQQDLVEIAEVFVYSSSQTADQVCQLGTTIAKAAWPKLPASS